MIKARAGNECHHAAQTVGTLSANVASTGCVRCEDGRGRKSRGRRVAVHVAVLGAVDREFNLNKDDHREPNATLNTNGKPCSAI